MKPKTVVLILLAALQGCASNRFFTDEEDAKARAACEETGCILVPVPTMRLLLDRLKGVQT